MAIIPLAGMCVGTCILHNLLSLSVYKTDCVGTYDVVASDCAAAWARSRLAAFFSNDPRTDFLALIVVVPALNSETHDHPPQQELLSPGARKVLVETSMHSTVARAPLGCLLHCIPRLGL